MTIPPGASVACGVDTLEPVCSRYVVEHRIIRLVRNEVRKHTVRKYGIQSTWFGYRFFSARAVRFELINRKSPPGTVNKYTQALTRTGGRTYRWRPASPQPARAAAPPTRGAAQQRQQQQRAAPHVAQGMHVSTDGWRGRHGTCVDVHATTCCAAGARAVGTRRGDGPSRGLAPKADGATNGG